MAQITYLWFYVLVFYKNTIVMTTISVKKNHAIWLTCSLLVLLLCCPACQKETLQFPWTTLFSNTNDDLFAVHFLNADTGFALGGDKYDTGIILKTVNGGNDWTLVNENIDKVIYDLDFATDQIGFASAFGNKILKTTDGGENWGYIVLHTGRMWQPFRAIHFVNDTLGFLAGGTGWERGIVGRTTDQGENWVYQHFKQEMRDVYFTSPTTGYLCGFGVIYKTTDGGDTWFLMNIDGDFFTSIHFPTPEVGYIVGNQGTIVKTVNAGHQWEKLRSAKGIFKSKPRFNKVYFSDVNQGYIVGDKLFWHTTNGGSTWQEIEDIDFETFNGIWVNDQIQKGFITGQNGTLLQFEK